MSAYVISNRVFKTEIFFIMVDRSLTVAVTVLFLEAWKVQWAPESLTAFNNMFTLSA